MRPMWVEFPADWSVFAAEDQHFVGCALLVHPVTQSSVTVLKVYLPGENEVLFSYLVSSLTLLVLMSTEVDIRG